MLFTNTVVGSVTGTLTSPIMNYAYLSVPLGWHTIRFYIYCVILNGSLVFLFRLASSDRVPPFLWVCYVFEV